MIRFVHARVLVMVLVGILVGLAVTGCQTASITAPPSPTSAPTVAPTPTSELTSLQSQAAEICSESVSPDAPRALHILGPVAAFEHFDGTDTWVYRNLDAPAIEAQHGADVQTAVCISEVKTKVGTYVDSQGRAVGSAMNISWRITVVQWQDGQFLQATQLDGADAPAGNRTSIEGHSGYEPQLQELTDWLEALVVEPDPSLINVFSVEQTANEIRFSPDGSTITTLQGTDPAVSVWDATSGQRRSQHEFPDKASSYVLSDDGEWLVLHDRISGLSRWSLEQETGVQQLEGYYQRLFAIAPDGKTVALLAASEGKIQIIDMLSGENLHSIVDANADITAMVFAPDQSALGIAHQNGAVSLWNIGSERLTEIRSAASGFVTDLTFSPDGTRLAIALSDGTIRLQDIGSSNRSVDLTVPTGAAKVITFSPDGTLLASAGADGTVRLWQNTDSPSARLLTGPLFDVTALAFSPDGAKLASASSDGTIDIWDMSKANS